MIWLTWRQFRLQMLTAWAVVATVTVVALATGRRLATLSGASVSVFDLLRPSDKTLYFAGVILLAVVPAIIGAFWGAPMVARDLESGTHRLVWNQSVTRTRWLLTRLGMTTLVAASAVGALSLAVTWWAGPLDGAVGAGRGSLPSRLTPVAFAMRGVVPVGYTILALVLGVTLGAVLRRTVPAMALTLGLFLGVQIVVPLWVRPHLAPSVPLVMELSRSTLDGIRADGSGRPVALTAHTEQRGDWILSNVTIDETGRTVSLPGWFGDCLTPPTDQQQGRVKASPIDGCLTQLTEAGYRQQVTYQPASRFWTLQWTEAALYLGASAVLAGFCLWWVRTRLS